MADGSAEHPYINAYSPTNVAFASFIGTGDSAWQQTASTLVGLQSLLGLVFIYGGLVKKKWAVNSSFMVLYAFAAAFITWVIVGYQIAFGTGWISLHSFFGKPSSDQMTIKYLEKQATLESTYGLWFGPTTYVIQPFFSNATMVYFQGMFCCITPVLIAGALLARTNFLAWMIFVPMWIVLSYCPGAFTMWGGGFFFKKGVMDFAGGYVIHLSAGVASFVAAAIIGPRLDRDRAQFPPNNVVLALGGAGVLWLGWNGFNGGATYNAMPISAIAILNTNIAAAMSSITWTVCDFLKYKKPAVTGAINGIITGLVVITPCAGFVEPYFAILGGFIAGTIPWFSMNYIGKLPLFKWVDDTLGVCHTHAVAGFLGGLMAGFFAQYHLTVDHFGLEPVTDHFPGTQGAVYGGWLNLGWQVAASLFIIALNLIMTPLILYFIKYALFIPLRMTEEHLERGDNAAHGEEAYALFGDGIEDTVGWYSYEETHHGTATSFAKPGGAQTKIVV